MRTLPALVVFAALASGCAYTRPFDAADAESRAAVSDRAARQSATVLVDGRPPQAARHLTVGADSTSWFDSATGALHVVPTADVAAVRFPRSERSAVRDLAVGVGSGMLVGGLLGAVFYDAPDILFGSRAEAVALGAAGFGLVGGSVGGIAALDAFVPERYVPADSAAVARRR